MKKVNITIAFDDEKLDALEFSLRKENTTVASVRVLSKGEVLVRLKSGIESVQCLG